MARDCVLHRILHRVLHCMSPRVLIVGGGPAGASTAWHLAQLGIASTILDRAAFPRDKVCAEYLSPQASRILDAMDALRPLEALGAAQLDGMKIRAPSGREFVGRFDAAHGFRGYATRGLAIRRTTLDALLLDRARAAGAEVIERTRVTDVLRDTSGRVCGVRVTDVHGGDRPHTERTIPADFVVGADGLHSIVGRRLGLVRTARRPNRIALVAHYAGVPNVGTLGEMHVEPDGYVGIAPVGHGLTNVALVVPATRDVTHDRAEFLDRWMLRHPHLMRRFAMAERMTDVRATGPFAVSAATAWVPGAALVGDAADFFDPFTGEGIYTALRGGELLAPFIADVLRNHETREHEVRALTAYEAARRAEFGGKWQVERIIAGVVAVPTLINHAARAFTRRPAMADLLVGVTGDFVPPREVLRFGYIARLLLYGV